MAKSAEIEMRFGPADEWTAEMTWDDEDHSGPSRLVVRPTEPNASPGNGISQTVLRGIDIASAVKLMRSARDRQVASPVPEDWATEYGPPLRALGANGITDPYLAVLSLAYSAAANSPKPLARLADVAGKSESAIKSHLWHATRNGFLERSPGRAGGAVTPKALSVLDLP